MEIEDTYRYMISGYFGVRAMDNYDLKEYVLQDMEQYIRDFIEQNPSSSFDFSLEVERIKDTVPLKTKLQDALLVLNKMEDVSIDLILQIKRRLKDIQEEIV